MPRLCLLCLLTFAWPAVAAGPTRPADPHETELQKAGLKADGPALLDFFRRRTLSDADQARLAALVRQLGADTFAARTRASTALVDAGRKAVAFLQPAVDDPDPEVARRARRCLGEIDAQPETPLVLAAAAVLARRKPAGAAEALLGYLPFLEEASALPPLCEALQEVGVKDGKGLPAVRAAARAGRARRRAAAAWVLGRLGPADRAVAVLMLNDVDPEVRYRAAEALVLGKDSRGVPGLLALLEKGPLELAGEAEGLLMMLAEDKAPAASLGGDPAERSRCAVAWQAWWRANGARLDLTKRDLASRVVGLRLVAANSGYGGRGAVWEYAGDRKTRWEMRDVGGPFDARMLPGGRLLLAEYDGRRVTERDRAGKVVWEYAPPNRPLEVQRLANGNTLVATNYEVVEVTRAKEVVFTHRDGGGDIFSAQKLSNGHVLLGLYRGQVVELDRTGKQVMQFSMERPRGLANIEVLPGGRYLLPLAGSHRVVVLDRTGKVVREVPVPSPTCAVTLPGGNLLIGSHILNSVREIDRRGNVVWQHKADGQVFRVRVR
jgi:hypothetical protein